MRKRKFQIATTATIHSEFGSTRADCVPNFNFDIALAPWLVIQSSDNLRNAKATRPMQHPGNVNIRAAYVIRSGNLRNFPRGVTRRLRCLPYRANAILNSRGAYFIFQYSPLMDYILYRALSVAQFPRMPILANW